MKKAQSFIIEFILFFAISFSLFTTLSYFFYDQNEYFRKTIGETTTELINNLVSTHIIKGINCKACDDVSIKVRIPSKIGGFFYIVQLNPQGLNTSLFSVEPFSQQTPVFNLNASIDFSLNESKSENKRVGIKINNVEGRVEVE